jgi:AcrR family transcriptional regulator
MMKGSKKTVKSAKGGKADRRAEILSATEKLIRSRGLSSVTTRAIAEEAGCSEGALYVHFKGRLELFLAVLEESLPEMTEPLRALDSVVGKATPEHNLHKALLAIFSFQQRVTPMLGGLFAEPELLMAYRKSLHRKRKGPHAGISRLQEYIRREQELGRIDSKIDAEMAANILMSSTQFQVFTQELFGYSVGFERFSKRLVSAVLLARAI